MPAYATWADVPIGERNVLTSVRDRWLALTGFTLDVPEWALADMAHYGMNTLADFGAYMHQATVNGSFGNNYAYDVQAGQLALHMPWAQYGLNKEQYSALSTTYGTEYKKITGQDISPDVLSKAFATQKDITGGFLSGSQYAAQLQQDQSIRDTYGWVKYGMDYNQFQQHKQTMTQAYGGVPSDSQGVQALQYWHQNQSATAEARAKLGPETKNAPVTPGDSTSVVR